jgi:murein L,D-transpeptidase YafK
VKASAPIANPAPPTASTANPMTVPGKPSVIPAKLPPAARAARRPKPYTADSLVLDKSERKLSLYQLGEKVAEYSVALGANPIGPKSRRGDGRTPEGIYYIKGRNPGSKYHLSLGISYPDSAQRVAAAKRGISPGGDIMIHGLPSRFATVGALHRQQDWTEGCIAVTNDEIEEIWRVVPDGARILIKP